MSLIDPTYFDGPLLLVGVNQSYINDAIQLAIDQYERRYLDKAIGAAFTDAFLYGLAHPVGGGFSSGFSSGFQIGGVADKWKWLRDGKTYTLANGKSLRWEGFVNTSKQSPIACYVYFWYRRQNATQTGQAGNEGISTSENASNTSPDVKMVRAWNCMVGRNYELYKILRESVDTSGSKIYPEFMATDYDWRIYDTINVFQI